LFPPPTPTLSSRVRVYKEERNYILGLVKKIRAAGVNVLLIQKSILRDATTDLSLHYLAKVRGTE
jgi:T-complex protein 1 subunit delta